MVNGNQSVFAHLTFIFWPIKTFVKKHQKLILGSKAAFDLYIMTWSWGYWTKITSWYISPPNKNCPLVICCHLLFCGYTLPFYQCIPWNLNLSFVSHCLYQCTDCMRLHYILLHIYIQQKNKSVHNHSAGTNRYL